MKKYFEIQLISIAEKIIIIKIIIGLQSEFKSPGFKYIRFSFTTSGNTKDPR